MDEALRPLQGQRFGIGHLRLLDVITHDLWTTFFKVPADTRPPIAADVYERIRQWYFQAPWNIVYDLVEHLAGRLPSQTFADSINRVLVRECAGFRLAGDLIMPITNESELSAVEEAGASRTPAVALHIQRAALHLSSRKNPDYRNSIKEAISAVEALCRIVSGNPKATLADGLKVIAATKKVHVHPALSDAFQKLYGYTSDESGIRHSLMDEDRSDFADAHYMLVACSAFVNYLTVKAIEAGLQL